MTLHPGRLGSSWRTGPQASLQEEGSVDQLLGEQGRCVEGPGPCPWACCHAYSREKWGEGQPGPDRGELV